jgi:hypothetical protein
MIGQYFFEKKTPKLKNRKGKWEKEARWSYLQAQAKQPSKGKTIDEAIIAGYQAHFRDEKRNVIGIKENDPSAH